VDHELSALLDDLYRRGNAHDQGEPDRLQRWRNVEPETAALMSVLVRALAPARMLELGTSNGYSTIWLAEAARAVDGHVTSVEIDPARSALAHENLRRAQLERFVELRVQDAGAALADSEDQSWPFIFLDAERPEYVSYWPDLRRVLTPGGLLIVDNVISHADQVEAFRRLIEDDDGVAAAVVPTGAGALLVVNERASTRRPVRGL
jgi:predicted O-methyltransferase YrrM